MLITAAILPLQAQLDAQFSQYMFNRIIYNPAYTGSESHINTAVAYRHQWMNLNGKPVTQLVTVDGPVEPIKSGVGMYIMNDKIGPERSTYVMATYSYKYAFDAGQVAFGFNGGVIQNTIDGSQLRASGGDYSAGINHNDNLIPDNTVSNMVTDFGFGAYYTNNNMYAGISVSHLTQPKLQYGSGASYKLARNYYLIGGYRYELNENLILKPSLLIKSDFNKTQLDININALYNKNIWGGLSYRGLLKNSSDAIIALAGVNVTEQFSVGYSYDVTTNKIRNYSSGTHEFLLSYRFRPFGARPAKLIFCPRFL